MCTKFYKHLIPMAFTRAWSFTIGSLQCSNWCITVQTSNGVALAQMDQRTKSWNIRDIRKVRKRQHQYPEFGHTQGENKKKPAKKYISSQWGVKLRKPWVSSWLSFFPERLHCCYIVFHCSYLYSCYNSSLTLCIKCWISAFRTEFQHFILRFNKISLLSEYH